jgi:hypothetical protein
MPVDSFTTARDGDVLAWESSANNVDWHDSGELVSGEESHVAEPGDAGPMLCEHPSAVSVDLAERDSLESACALKAEAESADSTE